MRREVSLDSWRGLMLVLMAVSHLGGTLGVSVRYQLGYLSSAEGFVLLSGVMCGLVYARYSRVSLRLMFERLWRRAGTIYAYHVSVLLILFGYVTLLAAFAPDLSRYFEQSDFAVYLHHPLQGLAGALTCLLLPENIGILGIYVAYIAFAPFVLTQFIRGRTALVVAVSAALWLFGQFGGGVALREVLPGHQYMEFGAFDVFSWQAVFVAGCYVGWRRSSAQDILPWLTRPVFFAVAAVTVALFIQRHWGPTLGMHDLWGATDLARLGWLRLINTGAFALTVYGIARFYGCEMRNAGLALLGAHSLQVFSFHALVLYLLYPVLWRVHALGLGGELVAAVLFVASLGIPARIHAHYRQRRAAAVAPASLPAGNLDMAGRRRYI